MTSRVLKGQPDPEGNRPNQSSGDAGSDSSPSSVNRGVIKQDVYSAQNEARQIRAEATADAERIRAEAQAEAERLLAEAEARGYEAGMEEWTRAITAQQESKNGQLERSRVEVLKLAVKIAEKVLGRELSDPEALGDMVLKAIRGIQHEGRILVKVRPEDLDAALSQRPRLSDLLGKQAELEIVPDSTIELGGCQIETAVGIIDAKLETQLRVLERVLLDRKSS